MLEDDSEFMAAYELNGVDEVAAEAKLRQIVAAHPTHFNALMLLGAICGDSDDVAKRDEALSLFLRALRLVPDRQAYSQLFSEENPVLHLGLCLMRGESVCAGAGLVLATMAGGGVLSMGAETALAESMPRMSSVMREIVPEFLRIWKPAS